MRVVIKHGMSNTRLYRAWDSMKSRCYRKTSASYSRYGGRGITICDTWRNSFEAFRDWALANGYADNLSLDRIDCDGNYEPSNCRWVTMKEQENNKRNNKLIEFKGVVLTQSEWCDVLEIPPHVMQNRFRRGWSVERAFTTEVRKYDKDGQAYD